MDSEGSSVVGVVLAAGLGRRFGGDKLSAVFRGKSLLGWALRTALDSRLQSVVVVLGHDGARLAATLNDEIGEGRVRQVLNETYHDGQASSVVAGLRAVPEDAGAVMFLMADQPLLTASAVDMLIAAYESSGMSICYPVCGGQRRSPVVFGRRHFAEILALRGDVGARGLIAAHSSDVIAVPFEDESLFGDVDHVADLRELNRIALERKHASGNVL